VSGVLVRNREALGGGLRDLRQVVARGGVGELGNRVKAVAGE
jgi:hypothetical protein